jgi:hypothetical protein
MANEVPPAWVLLHYPPKLTKMKADLPKGKRVCVT